MNKNSPIARREALASELRSKGLDSAIVSHPKHIFYFTGLAASFDMFSTLLKGPRCSSFLAISKDGESSLILGETELVNPWSSTKGRVVKRAEKDFGGRLTIYQDYIPRGRIVTYGDKMSDEFENWLKELNLGTSVGIEEWHLPESFRSILSKTVGGARLTGMSQSILSMRYTKGDDEITNLKDSTGMIDFAFQFAKKMSRPGFSEIDVYREMNYETFKKYGPSGWVNGDHVSGERTLEVGGVATKRRFRRGDTALYDLHSVYNNYWSDLCRTFVVGRRASSEQERAIETLTDTLEMVDDMLRPGLKGGEVFRAVEEKLSSKGYPRLPHHAGHAIGLDDQEPPWLIPNEERELREGCVCVVEPGIYLKETGGMRVEDAYLITKDGNERISSFPRSPV